MPPSGPQKADPSEGARPQSVATDPGKEQVGVVYAKAFLGAAESAGQTEALLEELDSFIEDVLEQLPDFDQVLSSGLVNVEDKQSLLDRMLAGRASPLLLQFLKVVAAHGRLDALRSIHRAAHEQFDVLRHRVRVEAVTATPLSKAQADEITQRLRKMVGGEPILSARVDSKIIGGLIVRVGDTVYDGSVARQLEQVRSEMINRSVHEIQSRRDRFRITEGS